MVSVVQAARAAAGLTPLEVVTPALVATPSGGEHHPNQAAAGGAKAATAAAVNGARTGGAATQVPQPPPFPQAPCAYAHVAVGGTFDRLHGASSLHASVSV